MKIPATEIRVNGIVQGVGFRPFVYRLAAQYGLAGFITNTPEGVIIRLAGDSAGINALIDSLRQQAPPLARIISLERSETTLTGDCNRFAIIDSDTGRQGNTHVSPDIATCADCRRDCLAPDGRRLGYPFTNCTNCGPRYSIIRTLPYDRPRTTMASFAMCPDCLTEYGDPSDRRFHAQPNACPRCGPRLEWRDREGRLIPAGDPLGEAAAALANGSIVGIRGLGGFHLAVDAYSAQGVALLRQRKNRPAKPLALMVRDTDTAKRLCFLSPAEEEQLTAIAAPVVLLEKRPGAGLAPNLAPGIGELGVMLPYTPLHLLLFNHPRTPDCLVMTSGNPAGEPLCKDNDEALRRLGRFCDGFLLHNRDIHTRVDDSVVRIIGGTPRFLRRSRGYAPAPVRLAAAVPPLLAAGAELKNCFCLARGRDAFMSQHIGDLNNVATLDFFVQTLDRLRDLLDIDPGLVVADLHPDYLSSRFAEQLGLPLLRVQHHFAHAASVMAEHGLTESLAVILDGTGYGPDRTVWGGEVLHCTQKEFRRLGRLSPLPMPGGDMAARQPWRMALAALHGAGIDAPEAEINLAGTAPEKRQFIREMIARDVNCPATSSCGRLFDAVSSLLGICQVNTYEGQAAMELEAAARAAGRQTPLRSPFIRELGDRPLFAARDGLLELSAGDCIRSIVDKITAGRLPVPDIALYFHLYLVSGFGNMIHYLHQQTGIDTVVLSGGSVQNRILAEGFIDFFAPTQLKLYTNVQVPANDGGLALGQALIGGFHVSGDPHAG
ncbi:MAG: carbamoyltransferase HypF [Desulfobulbaceae bacterium]|jgi:hydrogenase maturation protein HypF|nr:carbamoyltransferase HypF [Desulfobulbaceae bacterium]MDY0350408.1 carbamoyltransferase HypF [Desulfobulbaceae bacterium]